MVTKISCPNSLNMETVKYVSVFCSIFIVQAGAMKIFKIRDVNSQKNSAVEILNSYFDNLNDFTMCGRFRTPFLASTLDIWQNIVSIPSTDMWLLGQLLIINCDTRYDGCNDYYREILGEIKSVATFNRITVNSSCRE